jgi:Multiubiquitin
MKEQPMIEDDTPGPESEDKAIEEAIDHIHEAEHDLARAHRDETRAEHDLEVAVEQLDRAEHDRDVWVIVNGRKKEVRRRFLSFAEVVALAFPDVPPSENIIYTVAYRNGGNEHRPDGTLVEGESVKIKDGTIFDVTATNKS